MQNFTTNNQGNVPSCPYMQNNIAQPVPGSPTSPTAPFFPVTPSMPSTPGAVYPPVQEGPPTLMDINYIPGYLASNIGRNVRAEFILGTAQYVDKTGLLVDVGVNYFVLQDVNSRTYTMCDLYSVRFVTILY